MRVVTTGGAGFIGRAVVRTLAERGRDVVALVRDPARAEFLVADNVSVEPSDLTSVERLTEQLRGADAVIHGAGMYRIGLREPERQLMWDANVGTTERVLDAAVQARLPRVVYISTVNAFGNTHGQIVDETYRRDLDEGFLSYYDETKYRAHQVALERIAGGAPIVVVQPSQTYGPNDHTEASAQLQRAHAGELGFKAFANLGLSWVHVDDLAAGIVAALDRGRTGECYALAGDCKRLSDSIEIAAKVGKTKPPRLALPTTLLRAVAPVNDRVGGLPGMPYGMREILRSSDGVTYWAGHDKATRELGFEPRSLEQGIADTWGDRRT